MAVTNRSYQHPSDFQKVGDFLIEHYQPGNCDGNWLQPTWEYMHSHPSLDETALDQIGVWEEHGRIVAVAHYESRLGEAFFEIAPGYAGLKAALLDYAERRLSCVGPGGEQSLHVYINDFDQEFARLARERGYQRLPDQDRPMSLFAIQAPFPAIQLPDGFSLKSLQEDNDLYKINRVLWRGFNHPGEPPEDLAGREKMQSGPNFHKELNIVVEARDGNFAAYAGLWYQPDHRYAYVEPVATDPSYRRRGLGKAAVLEGIRRCAALGARVAWVGSDLPFYLSIGFRRVYASLCWQKTLVINP